LKKELTHFIEKTEFFLSNLSLNNSFYQYKSSLEGNTTNGLNLKLGYSCFALKIYYTLNLWENLDLGQKKEWTDYINSFQQTIQPYPENSFIDENLLKGYESLPLEKRIKKFGKQTLNFLNLIRYDNDDLSRAITAESKQAIASLYQVGSQNQKKYFGELLNENSLENSLLSLNWNRPWSAGAQFANQSLLNVTQLNNEKINDTLYSLLGKLVHKENGFYYSGNLPSQTELINGAMKILTGLEWLNMPIHYPEKLIDYCLSSNPNHEGCDLVDVVYVLYRSSLQTDYRKNDILDYFEKLYEIIFKHYYPETGGFSYYLNKSQIYYYGLYTSKGLNCPDIHGTVLLTWALSMMLNISEDEKYNWKVIKA